MIGSYEEKRQIRYKMYKNIFKNWFKMDEDNYYSFGFNFKINEI